MITYKVTKAGIALLLGRQGENLARRQYCHSNHHDRVRRLREFQRHRGL
ncbi:MAG: hypothetical protein LUH48_03025 [Clostridiales bacterium]|nr:hypothetical protein [Clostridiales bacterium]